MTDHDDDDPNVLAELFAALDRDRPPADVVPHDGITLATVKAMNAMAGSTVDLTTPGEVLVDPDGLPIAVEPSTHSAVTMCGLTITQAEADRLGVTEEEYPHVNII